MTLLYFVWLLVPLIFLLLAMWSAMKPLLKLPGREHGRNYVKQGLFCFAAYLVAVWIDSREGYRGFLDNNSFWKFDLYQLRWLLYPAILVALAYGQQLLSKKQKRIAPTSRRR